MNWLIIVLILIVAVGPVLYLLPNAKDKRLTALRLYARQKGLSVKITNIKKLNASADERVSAGGVIKDPTLGCIAYQLPVDANLELSGELLLLKVPAEPTQALTPVLPGWVLADDSMAPIWTRLIGPSYPAESCAERLEALPDDAVAWGFDGRFVSCYWRERAEVAEDGTSRAVDEIASLLDAFKQDLIEQLALPSTT